MVTTTNDRAASGEEEEYTREELAQMLLDNANRIWTHMKRAVDKVLTDWGGYAAFDTLARTAAKYPLAALVVVLAIMVVSLPFAILLAFGLSTMAMTFTGFLLLEGTLLTIASVLLFGCLGALLLVFLFFGVLAIAGYFGFAHIYDLYNDSNSPTALNQFLWKKREETEPQSTSNDSEKLDPKDPRR